MGRCTSVVVGLMMGLGGSLAHAQTAPAEGFRWVGVQWRADERPQVIPVIFANREECEFNSRKLEAMAEAKGEPVRQWMCQESYLPPSAPSP